MLNRISVFVSLPMQSLDRLSLQKRFERDRQHPAAIGLRRSNVPVRTLSHPLGGPLHRPRRSARPSLPGVFQAIGGLELAKVNLPVAALIWLMIVPMLVKIDFAAIAEVRRHWRGIGVTLFINWAVKPFTMAALGWIFIAWLFRPLLPEAQIESYIAGLILLAAAPCTAMVFVWSNLSDGDANFTLSQVALNDVDHGGGLRADRRRCCWGFRPLRCRGTRWCCPW